MDKDRRIIDLLQQFKNSGNVFFNATISNIQGNTCTIKVDDITISNVRLKPTTDETEDENLLVPAEGSNVLVGSFSGDYKNLFVLQANTLSEIYYKIGEMSLKVNKDGIVFNDGKNNGLMNISEVVSWMKKVYNDMRTLKGQLSTHTVAGNGAPLGLFFNPSTPNPIQNTFEDKNVTH